MSREPWWKCKVGIIENPKVAALPNDSARWGWIKAMSKAKTQPRLGAFLDRRALTELLGRHGRYVEDYLCVRLLEEAPKLCPACKEKHPDAQKGEVVIHDYRREQVDPTNADRQADWRETHAAATRPERNAPRNGKRNGDITDGVTPYSRARGMTVTVTERDTSLGNSNGPTQREAPPSPDVMASLLNREQKASWRTFGPEWDDFKRAWVGKGFKFAPIGDPVDDPEAEHPSQRAMLYSVLRDRPDSLPEWVRESRSRTAHETVADVLKRWHSLRLVGKEAM